MPFLATSAGFGFGQYNITIDDKSYETDGFQFASSVVFGLRLSDRIALAAVGNFDPIFKVTGHVPRQPALPRSTAYDISFGAVLVYDVPPTSKTHWFFTGGIVYGGDFWPQEFTGATGTGPMLHASVRVETGPRSPFGPELRVMIAPMIDGEPIENNFASLSLGLGGHFDL